MFKTPGKLRGKTPRTARKQNALAPRQPLTDIFAPNAQPAPPQPAQTTTFYDKVAQFQIAEDAADRAPPQHAPVKRGTSPQRVAAGKPYTDSGYHGMMTEDEMELDALTQTESVATSSQAGEPVKVPLRENQPPPLRLRDGNGDDNGVSDESFVSAKEQESQDGDGATGPDVDMEDAAQAEDASQHEPEDDDMQNENVVPAIDSETTREDGKASEAVQDNDVDMDMEAEGTPQSDASSPEKPLQRKSSFTFSSLPAREPLGAKRSMGQIDRARSSVFSKSMNKNVEVEDEEDELAQEKPEEARAHSKTSTQLLHERINMLGKMKEPRSSKSIPQSTFGQAGYPQLPDAEPTDSQKTQPFDFEFPQRNGSQNVVTFAEDEDDEWIAPTKPAQAAHSKQEATVHAVTDEDAPAARPTMHQKSNSTFTIMSPGKAEMAPESRHQKAMSVSHPNVAEVLDSSTPAGSPMGKKQNEGHLSASKSRLWSALKSAKSIFASSASTSAAARLEAHIDSPAATRSPKRNVSGESGIFNMPGGLYSTKELMQIPTKNASVISFSPSRKTRSSSESDKKREKELRAQEKAANELEKAREKERQKAAKQQAEEKAKADKAERVEAARLEKERKQAAAQAERPASAGSGKSSQDDMPPPPPPKSSMLPAGKLKAPGRLMRPTKESAKPAPVSIKVASQSQRLGQSTNGLRESAAPAPPAKEPARAGSVLGNRPGSAQLGNSRGVKALEAAARKKEADNRAAAKKAEQKRELERKRAAKAEEDRRAEEERKAYEQQKVQEAKLAAHRNAAENHAAAEARKREQERAEQQKREQERLEQQRREQERHNQQRREQERYEQQRRDQDTQRAHDLAASIAREREQKAQGHPRGDVQGGTLRQLTKSTMVQPNPAKPPKRMLPADDEESAPQPQPQRPGIMRGPPSYQQTDAKRRKTNEDQEEPNERRSVMAPPKRPSTMRKETLSKFSHGYTHAPPPAAHHSSMFKSTVNAQHQMQHKPTHPSQLVQMSNARIPFAENANPPASHSKAPSSHMHPGYENANPNKYKTPSRPAHAPKSAKSTPQYPNGDNIDLPDIATDSEDESEEEEGGGGFRAPSWVASPALRDLLTQQQLVDPETVFGPIGELKMDEVFKNNKNQERLKRFRERGSSAMWHETGDAVTSAEKRKDMEMRERVVREGGWRYEPNA